MADVVVIKEGGRKKNRFIKFGKGKDEGRETDGKGKKGESGVGGREFVSNGGGSKNEFVGDLCQSPVKSDASLNKKSDREPSQGSSRQPSPEKLHSLEKSAQPETPPPIPEPEAPLTPDVEPHPILDQNLKSSFVTVDSDRIDDELDSSNFHQKPPPSQIPTPTNNPSVCNNDNLLNFDLQRPKPVPTQETSFSDRGGNIITCKIGGMIERSDSSDYDDLPLGHVDESQEFFGQIIDSQAEIQDVPTGYHDGLRSHARLAENLIVSSPLRSHPEDEELTLWNQKIPNLVGSVDGDGEGSGDGEVNFMETGEFGDKL